MPSPKPKDIILYENIKKDIIAKYKPSAYRSGMIVRKYKEAYALALAEGKNKYKSKDAYFGNKQNSNLKRWFDEKWTNQRGTVGYQNKNDVYRPNIIINSKTPITFKELTSAQIKKAQKEKASKGRVKKFISL